MPDPDRKPPGQESPDLRNLIEGDAGPPPPIGLRRDDHERPDGPLGAVVKDEYRVAPTDADEVGKAGATAGPEAARTPSGKRARKGPGNPADLRAEIAELRAKLETGHLKPADKGRLLDLQAELAEAETPT